MKMSKSRYPVDTDQFQKIREQGKLYVDKTKTHVFVFELKVDDMMENALAQIDDKGYAIPYEAKGELLDIHKSYTPARTCLTPTL